MSEPNTQAVAEALAAPFDPGEVKFKAQAVSGNRALAVPFVDARVVQDRLDAVLGVMGWQDSYECLPDGAVVCRLRIRLGTEWITKEDVGGQSEQPDEGDRRKAAFSDALKRAAVKLGIGRYLYRQKPQWVDYDPQKRQFLKPPALPVTSPTNHRAPATPATPRPRPAPSPATNGKRKPADGLELYRRLEDHERVLVREGLCDEGEFLDFIRASGAEVGFGEDIAGWNSAQAIGHAYGVAKLFEHTRRQSQLIGAEQMGELERLVEATGKDWEKLMVELRLGRDTAPSGLSYRQFEMVKEHLQKSRGNGAPAKAKAG